MSDPQASEYALPRARRGQRQLARAWVVWVVVVGLLLGTAGSARAQSSHRHMATVDLPAIPLAVAEADGWIVASLGLSGAAFVETLPWEGSPRVLIREDWQTLSVRDLEGTGMLMAGRDGMVRYVVCDPPGSDPILISSFPVEGVPNDVVLDGTTLIVAAGGAGLSLWEWPNRKEVPTLRGRYPFVEFARRVALEPEGGRLYVADSIGGRVVVLDVRDPSRPRLEEFYPVSSFCDSVEVGREYLLFTDRNGGSFVARRAPETLPSNLWLLRQEIPLIAPYQERMDAKRAVLVAGEGSFFLCEAEAGVRHFRTVPDTRQRFQEVARYRPQGAAVDAALLTTGHLVVADHPHGLSFFRLAETPERP